MKPFLLLVVSLMICCCGFRGNKQVLTSAERLMQEHPDSALAILENLDTTTLHSAKWKAKYSLLYEMALDKNYIDTTNVSVLSAAMNYYMRKGTDIEKAKCLYYLGCIHSNAGEYDAACVSLIQALRYAANSDDPLFKGMICTAISMAYSNNFDEEDELLYIKQAVHWFTLYGDNHYIDNARYLLALAYHHNRLHEEADSLYKLINPEGRFAQKALIGRAANEIIKDNPDAIKAICLFEEAISNHSPFTISLWYQYAFALCLAGNKKEADCLIRTLHDSKPSPDSYWWHYRIADYNGNTDEALLYLKKYSQYREKVVKSKLKQSIYKAEKNYYQLSSELERNNARESRLKSAIYLALLILASLVSTLIIVKKNLDSQKRLTSLYNKYAEAERLLLLSSKEATRHSETERKLESIQASFASMYKAQFSRIGDLYNKNLELALLNNDTQRAYSAKVSEILSEISDNPELSKLFEERINKDLDNVMAKIRADFPSLGEKNYRFLSYVCAGFKDSTIENILDDSNGAVRTRRYRLRKQILSAPSPNHDLYALLIK